MTDKVRWEWPRAALEDWTATWMEPGEPSRWGAILDTEPHGIALVVWLWRHGWRLTMWWRPCRWCVDPICSGEPCVYSDDE